MSFPEKIFNGRHAGRESLSNVRAPNHSDYMILVHEIQAVQEYLLNLTQNTKIMPELANELSLAKTQLVNLQCAIQEITPPDELLGRLEKLETQVQTIDVRKQIAMARCDIETQRTVLASIQLEVLKIRDSIGQEVTGFQNRMYNMFQNLQKETLDRIEKLEEGMKQANVQIEISNLLKKLQ